MLKMLIADDEPLMREALACMIDWSTYQIEVIGSCANGHEAYRMILRCTPDIVLTDIKMPGMDGLELIKKVSLEAVLPQFIIISGYDYFDYARHAMRYGVKHYLLKPVNRRQLQEAVEQCINEHQSIRFIRRLRNFSQPAATANPMIQQIIDYVNTHLQDSGLTLKYIAQKQLFMNVDYVSKKFYRETGQKFSHYLGCRRIERAKELIRQGGKISINELACLVGYANNPQYFSQLFKKLEGQTPREYLDRFSKN